MNPAPARPAAVIFDFDGVLVDTEPLHFEAFRRLLEPLGRAPPWDAYQQLYMGFDDRDAFRAIFKNAGRPVSEEELPAWIEAKAELFGRLARERGVTPYPGVVRLILGLKGCVPLALCSGSLRSDVEPILDRAGIRDAFEVVVTAEDVSASKPDPESYRQALRRLENRFPDRRFPPSACVAIEDTPAGIAAARGAGLKVLAVQTTHRSEDLRGAERIVESLEFVTMADLEALAHD